MNIKKAARGGSFFDWLRHRHGGYENEDWHEKSISGAEMSGRCASCVAPAGSG